MKLSAKTEYACRALLELALHWPHSSPLQIAAIADKQHIPMKFLPHILIELKQLGYVDSSRGKMGGYILSKPPEEIRLSDVVGAFSEGPSKSSNRQKKVAGILDSIWQEIENVTQKHMSNINFEKIRDRERNLKEVPDFNI